jgi:hypothetical protein
LTALPAATSAGIEFGPTSRHSLRRHCQSSFPRGHQFLYCAGGGNRSAIRTHKPTDKGFPMMLAQQGRSCLRRSASPRYGTGRRILPDRVAGRYGKDLTRFIRLYGHRQTGHCHVFLLAFLTERVIFEAAAARELVAAWLSSSCQPGREQMAPLTVFDRIRAPVAWFRSTVPVTPG